MVTCVLRMMKCLADSFAPSIIGFDIDWKQRLEKGGRKQRLEKRQPEALWRRVSEDILFSFLYYVGSCFYLLSLTFRPVPSQSHEYGNNKVNSGTCLNPARIMWLAGLPKEKSSSSLDISFNRHLFQLLDTKAFPDQPRHVVAPACLGASPGSPPSLHINTYSKLHGQQYNLQITFLFVLLSM